MCKYREARDLCDKMTRRFPEHRLNCEEILAQKNLWALNDNEFDPLTELRNVPNFNRIEHTLVYTFITAGLLWYKLFKMCLIS
jgi:hypothetical protein